ncbi:MAG: class I SAM-dependent methyltransferase, partial [Gemmatimonadetes bacterium]|nr:class I SAM-dependent methyltransferase [Gemmatimonadota bacterium]
MSKLDPEIGWYYDKGGEAARLTESSFLEEARTRRIIARRLGDGPKAIADIGAGPGAYSVWLAGLGHEVHVLDPVERHVREAQEAADAAGVRLSSCHEGRAENLPYLDAEMDAALLLGPLYHLTRREDRVAALREARRVVRPDGPVFAAAISRYASAMDGFFRDYVREETFAASMQRTLRDGQHRNPDRHDGFFTTAYFHKADELRYELRDAGFRDVELLAIEGPFTSIPDLN